jgi:YidC/Oxa1 family membrane protein insertase
MPQERRILLAFLLSMGVLFLWATFFAPPPPPPRPAAEPAAQEAPATDAAQTPAVPAQVAAPEPLPAIGAATEQIVVVENELVRVTFSNRGAVVQKWELLGYRDDRRETLDVVHGETAQQLGGWPMSLLLEDGELEKRANEALFEVLPGEMRLRAPAELVFRWSDGRMAVSKTFRFDRGYQVAVESSVEIDGRPAVHALAWRSGFGDDTVFRAAETTQVLYRANEKVERLEVKKLGSENAPTAPRKLEAQVSLGGLMDRYFTAVFFPPADRPIAKELALWHWQRQRKRTVEGKEVEEPVAEMAAGTAAPGPLAARLYVGPKELEALSQLTPPLTELVDFGWFSFIGKPLFYFLKWIHSYIPNYGWAIVLMTIIINMVLFPLKVKSFRSMQKMQRAMPEIKQIQAKYKKYGMRDPRKQQEQQEIMAVWKREGVNPMGGCLPMLLQMPIWIGLYQMLNASIELRHAPWMLWIRDLSARDPYYILPVVMALTMWLMQKMTPTTATDPMQQRMMTLMPIMFGGMFVIIPISSGLVLYILTSNVVGIAQQWYLIRSAPKPDTGKGKKGKKKRREGEADGSAEAKE